MPKTWLLMLVLAATPEGLPDALKRLETVGQVTYEEYDPRREHRERPGLTLFQINVDRKYTYRWHVEQTGSDGRKRMSVELMMSHVEVTVSHRIQVPEGRSLRDRTHRELMFHEFDHVAISADPRLRRLLEDRLKRPLTAERWLEKDQQPVEDWVEELHQDDLDRSVKLATELVRHHYERLDALTSHGLAPLPDRDGFFEALYTSKTLKDAGFEP